MITGNSSIEDAHILRLARQKEQEAFAELAVAKFPKLFANTELLHYRQSGILDDKLNSWVSGGAHMLLLPRSPESNYGATEGVSTVKFYIDAQESLLKSEMCPGGMFLVNVGTMAKCVPEVGGRMNQVYCTYVVDEDKFYFKHLSLLKGYSKKLTGKRANSYRKKIGVLLTPKEGGTGDDMVKEAKENKEFFAKNNITDPKAGLGITQLGEYTVTTESPLYFTEDEFNQIINKANEHTSNYPADMKLSFKILKHTLTRY